MLSLAVGIIAVVLIAVSRHREASVSLTEGLAGPAAAISLGAAVLNLWLSPLIAAAWAPAGLLAFLLAAFQAESAFALMRPRLRPAAFRAGLVVNASALVVWLFWHVAGGPAGPTAGTADALTGADIALAGFEGALVIIVGVAAWSGRGAGPASRRITSAKMIEIRSFAVATVTLLTFLALAGQGHSHA